ncbi:GDP-mannose 4,6-dehydratase [Paenibacillus sp. GYB003]|uniref:GDP-mannose 4,6-dehydratase n=1 Tax=Paenibacillus sp. GYB003 TaxID=2994392 RepID=UPI002F968858
MRALITGVTGFVGRHLEQNLIENGYEVWGGTRKCSTRISSGEKIVELDFSQPRKIVDVLEELKPNAIFHLSGQSSVKYSWDHIQETYQSNVMDAIGLFEAIKSCSFKNNVKIISSGSSEEYGLVRNLPILEEEVANPMNPYGHSKLAVSQVITYFSKFHGLNIIHTRAFNHLGPGQTLGFVTSDFAKQIVDIEHGNAEPTLYVGDLSSKRDFTDVRDIVNAYRLLYEKGESGHIYNICSGASISIQTILNTLVSYSSRSIEIKVDEKKLRPNDVKEYYGSNNKLVHTTGWEPIIPLETSLKDVYLYWKSILYK